MITFVTVMHGVVTVMLRFATHLILISDNSYNFIDIWFHVYIMVVLAVVVVVVVVVVLVHVLAIVCSIIVPPGVFPKNILDIGC